MTVGRDQVRGVVGALPGVVSTWERALSDHDKAVRHREVAVARADRRIRALLGGMSLRRWRSLVSGQTSIRSSLGGREMHLARKRSTAVEAALRALAEVEAIEQAKVATAELVLADATRRLIRYGPMAEEITGQSMGKLRRIARPPRGLQTPPCA
jgi:hypothetical protein